ncbi:MAG: polysaccharide export protein [Deltaproteobacteria bacterium]|nr:polysaccharide export protein [Deltaproteobacteria bacterium]
MFNKIFLIFLILISCASPEVKPNKTIHEKDVVLSDSTLGPGDLFDIRVYGEKELSGQFRVSSEGTMDYPLIGTIKVADLTPSQIKTLLEKKLLEGEFLKNPQVSILVKEYSSKKISVLGEVNKPGSFSYHDGMGVVEAISLAGGFTPMARSDKTTVTRIVDGQKQNIIIEVHEISQGNAVDFNLRPGDLVFVPERVF